MAIYQLSIKIISRGKGGFSGVAAAAYRAAEKTKNEYDGIPHDYTRKGGVVHTEILLPDNAPPEYTNRAVLWNAVEKIEKAKNSQLTREIEIALPVELTREQSILLAVSIHAPARGTACDALSIRSPAAVSIHAPARGAALPYVVYGWGAGFRFMRPHGAQLTIDVTA